MIPEGGEMRTFSLNLHCMQEDQPLEKLRRIADFIISENIDVVLLQEVAQSVDGTFNAALYILDILLGKDTRWQMVFDWSHYGWEIWQEGLAILIRGNLEDPTSTYISQSDSKDFWKSRIALTASWDRTDQGLEPIQFWNVHLGWWDDVEEPQQRQLQQLHQLVQASTARNIIVGGDFNSAASTLSYTNIIETTGWLDTYLACNPEGMLDPTIGGLIDGWTNGDPEGMRIDYVFLARGELVPVSAQIVLQDPMVSDHCGLYCEFN